MYVWAPDSREIKGYTEKNIRANRRRRPLPPPPSHPPTHRLFTLNIRQIRVLCVLILASILNATYIHPDFRPTGVGWVAIKVIADCVCVFAN